MKIFFSINAIALMTGAACFASTTSLSDVEASFAYTQFEDCMISSVDQKPDAACDFEIAPAKKAVKSAAAPKKAGKTAAAPKKSGKVAAAAKKAVKSGA